MHMVVIGNWYTVQDVPQTSALCRPGDAVPQPQTLTDVISYSCSMNCY